MGCNCGNAAASGHSMVARRVAKNAQNSIQAVSDEPCEFTMDMVLSWLEKAKCFKKQGLYIPHPIITKRKLNAFIGQLQSALNFPDTPCRYYNQLTEIQSFMMVVTLNNLCVTTT